MRVRKVEEVAASQSPKHGLLRVQQAPTGPVVRKSASRVARMPPHNRRLGRHGNPTATWNHRRAVRHALPRLRKLRRTGIRVAIPALQGRWVRSPTRPSKSELGISPTPVHLAPRRYLRPLRRHGAHGLTRGQPAIGSIRARPPRLRVACQDRLVRTS